MVYTKPSKTTTKILNEVSKLRRNIHTNTGVFPNCKLKFQHTYIVATFEYMTNNEQYVTHAKFLRRTRSNVHISNDKNVLCVYTI